jgi:hypothetical protein
MSGEAYPDIPTNALSLLRTYLHHAVTILHFTLDQDSKKVAPLLVCCAILGFFFPFKGRRTRPVDYIHQISPYCPLPHKETNGSF